MHPRAAELIDTLRLQAHPEGGRYRRIYTSATPSAGDGGMRPALSAIHYLLCAGEISRWHRIDADEIWMHHEGDALELMLFDAASRTLQRHRLGRSDATAPTHPLVGVPAGIWQAARPLGPYALVGCSVAPAFDFCGFALIEDFPEVVAALAAAAPAALAYR